MTSPQSHVLSLALALVGGAIEILGGFSLAVVLLVFPAVCFRTYLSATSVATSLRVGNEAYMWDVHVQSNFLVSAGSMISSTLKLAAALTGF